MFYGIRPILTITQPSNLQRFRCQSTIQLETALCYQHYFCNTELRNCNNSRNKRTFDSDTTEHVCIILHYLNRLLMNVRP